MANPVARTLSPDAPTEEVSDGLSFARSKGTSLFAQCRRCGCFLILAVMAVLAVLLYEYRVFYVHHHMKHTYQWVGRYHISQSVDMYMHVYPAKSEERSYYNDFYVYTKNAGPCDMWLLFKASSGKMVRLRLGDASLQDGGGSNIQALSFRPGLGSLISEDHWFEFCSQEVQVICEQKLPPAIAGRDLRIAMSIEIEYDDASLMKDEVHIPLRAVVLDDTRVKVP